MDRDLFDPNATAGPDGIFEVKTGSKEPTGGIFQISAAAPPADFTFLIQTLSDPADLILEVLVVKNFNVLVHDQSFLITRGPTPPARIFVTSVRAPSADTTFFIRRGPDAVDYTFETVVVTDPFVVTTGIKPIAAGFIHFVAVGPDVAPRPDTIHEVTIGGEGLQAPPADSTFQVRRGPELPYRIYDLTTVETLDIVSRPAPFEVTVSADLPNQIFEVISSAPPADQIFNVITQEFIYEITVGPGLFTQAFVIDRFEPPFVVTVNAVPADQVFNVVTRKDLVVTVDAPQPDQFFFVSVEAVPDAPDEILGVSVIDSLLIDALENSFAVSTGARSPDQTFDVEVDGTIVFQVTVVE